MQMYSVYPLCVEWDQSEEFGIRIDGELAGSCLALVW
jgi:hypothetical protein